MDRMRRGGLRAAAALALALLLGAALWGMTLGVSLAAPQATVRYVSAGSGSDSGACATTNAPCATLQYAVDQAASGDEIRIATLDNGAPNIYTGTSATIVEVRKDLTLRGGYLYTHLGGVGVWMPPTLPLPAPINGEGERRPLAILGGGAGVSVTVRMLALYNGHADQGGNLYAENAELRLVGTPILSGTATAGGGLYLKQCTSSFDPGDLTNAGQFSGMVLVSANHASYGGGMYVEGGTPGLALAAIYSNTASVAGGGLYVKGGAPTLTGGLISQNRAAQGGGLYLENSLVRLAEMQIYSNTASAVGGGLYIKGNLLTSMPLLLNNVIRYNESLQGGGLYFDLTTAGLLNNIIADNVADTGAALYLLGSSPMAFHNTVAHNSASNCIYVTHKPGAIPILSRPTFTNTIIAFNGGPGIFVESTGVALFDNRVVVAGTLWHANEGKFGGPVVESGSVLGDPVFTCTGMPPECLMPYHLSYESAAIDQGTDLNAILPDTDMFVDIDGQLRPSGAGYDIGADEVVSQTYGVWLLPPLSLRAGRAGTTVTHTHRLFNTGTQTDTYDLRMTSSSGQATLLTPGPITLRAQTSATVQVRLTLPATLTEAYTETTTLTATSRVDAQARATAVDLTVAPRLEQMDVSVVKTTLTPTLASGATAHYTLTVWHIGVITRALRVVLTDTLTPAAAAAAIHAPESCDVNLAAGVITCVVERQPSSALIPQVLTITVTTRSDFNGRLINSVAAAAPVYDANPNNNRSSVVVNVGRAYSILLPLVLRKS